MTWADRPAAAWVLAACAFVLAAAGAKPYASSWNDGSRLASVEALVERGTFCIDGTTFLERGGPPAYDPANPVLARATLDKLLINGRYYSDKPPLVSLPLAGAYRALVALGAPAPSARPDVFAWVMCVLLSGTGFAVAIGCMWALGTRAGLEPKWRLWWLGAFVMATMLPAYTRSANNHIAQLGAVAALCVLLCRIADAARAGRTAWGALVGAGLLTGFAYNLDLGVGPPLVPAVLLVVAVRTRRLAAVVACGLATLPCILTGHLINYQIGGDFLKPLNMNPEYLAWPGSPFTTTMTGIIRPRPFAQFLYTFDMLFGKKGFFMHNPSLMLPLLAGVAVLRQRATPHRVELLALCGWCAAGWLMYGALSKNHGGACVSIRWFLPFLAPGFWLLAKVLAERPTLRRDFVAISVWGVPLAASAWLVGPWCMGVVPGNWFAFAGALVTWGTLRYRAWRAKGELATLKLPAPSEAPARAA